ncbi:CHASE2 domain-containing protein [Leptolyngbya cf. ectocarpi LEGE 11479]|uniref:CHASE2 domain-containing protein n=1 Tax=Leptolyngbya cf. ectocarpi LEGE 11479 TaxID=1828722 RepID=A0A928ZUR8_LEPEC|nr:CHASE2 domain-containing protein [Leptolyngbya ectocarpi]MBE9067770.1 CHASE2 domain-containing protein [Leptolyngbya cf. ectocarpi LEGE 11479]
MDKQSRWEKALDMARTSFWGLGIILTVLGARSLGAFHALELMALDNFLALNTRLSLETTDEDIVLVEIDQPYAQGIAEKGYTIEANTLANILETIFANEPTVVGADIISYRITGDNQERLLELINQHPNLITVANYSSNPAEPLSNLTETQLTEQVGFNDLLFDRDGTVRRALLGFFLDVNAEQYKSSFAIQVAKGHFANKRLDKTGQAIQLENGIRDSDTMRFGDHEIPRIVSNYGYTGQQTYGIQTLINYRSNSKPFEVIMVSDLLDSQSDQTSLIKDKIIILSLSGTSRDFAIPIPIFDSTLSNNTLSDSTLDNSYLASGIEIQTHIISQIVQAVEAQRPLIWTNQTAQYVFLILFSILAISCGRYSKDTLSGFISLLLTIFASIFLSYLFWLRIGLWLPLAATLVSTTANGLIYINYAQNKRRWGKMIEQLDLALDKERHLSEKLAFERQKTIENVFDSIHNGPLQTLANLLRRTRDESIDLTDVCFCLEDLNREIRYIGDSIRQDASDQTDSLDVSYAGTKFDLDIPLQELFQEVYDAMLSRPLIGFSNLKFTIISFESIESEIISIEAKRKLCRFLEEALGNVGKHAIGATRLMVTGKNKSNQYELTVSDNGPGINSSNIQTGEGTRIGKEVEKITRGKFIHKPNKPKGFFCQLTFPIST